ncbi:MAG: putative LPS assembly protein LptD [Chitinophagales bacterium]
MHPDTVVVNSAPDSNTVVIDSGFIQNDTIWYAISPDALDTIIQYSGADSVVYDIDAQKTYIYTNGEITYKTFYLRADYIVFDWQSKTIHCYQVSDSLGNKQQQTYFKDGTEDFYAEEMSYNFGTQKGKIYSFRRQEGEGYIGVQEAKKLEDDSYYGKRLTYTTCDLEHPHFYIEAQRAKVIPQKIAVTGPANLVVADVPTPLFLPFGIFPIKRGQTSGIIIPQYGNHFSQGFFLREGGYYFALGDHYDLSLTGDIYSRGSYGFHGQSKYNYRYKFNGSLGLDYSVNKYGLSFDPAYSENKGIYFAWTHHQDAKARPNGSFSANVRIGSNDFLSNNSYNASYLTNQLNSSISYQVAFPNSPFALTTSLRHSQNLSDNIVSLTLPEAALTMNRLYPFKSLPSNRNSFLYQLGVSYSANLQNSVSAPDSVIFQPGGLDNFDNGMQHRINASAPVKILKYFTLSPTVNYTENWYLETIRRHYAPDTIVDTLTSVTGEDSLVTHIDYVREDTVNGFRAARYYSVGASMNTKVYSLIQFNGKLKAIRHVMTPTVSFNYTPDFSESKYGYYGSYYAAPDAAQPTEYSIFQNGVYGGPPSGRVGSIGFNVGNTLEAKVYSKKDTVKHEKKIRILENLSFGTAYNLAADSLNLSDIGFSGYTTLFKNLRFNFSGSFDPYILDSTGRNLDQFEWNINHRVGRFNGGFVSVSSDFRSKRSSNRIIKQLRRTKPNGR